MKIMTVVGARPQFVKAAVLSRLLADHGQVSEVLVHTGQHYDENMSQVFFEQMAIPHPQYSLKTGGQNHGAMTGQMLIELEPLVMQEKPDLLLVYGDTNSTLAGALVAAKLHVPVAHVEAGLRSFNRLMPEELNRILTDQLSDILFCSSEEGRKHLKNEGIAESKVHVVGDIMYDAALFYAEFLKPSVSTKAWVESQSHYALCTLHRAENTGHPGRLKSIFRSLRELSEDIPVYLPLHPRTQKYVEELNIDTSGLSLVEPLPYGDILFLLKNTQMVVTDSGGMQKEAYFFAKPCVTLRDETEWVETVQAGANHIVGASPEKFQQAVSDFKDHAVDFSQKIYGNGDAGKNILNHILQRA